MTSVSLTFDVDAEAGLGAALAAHRDRLSTLSERRFAIERGLPRIVEILGAHDARATFYVPGATAERYPEAIAALSRTGHEIAHHGHDHLITHEIDESAQQHEIDAGLDALRPHLPERFGYRSPAWELTPSTLTLLAARGFTWDSSLMGDDRPYWIEAGSGRLLELPIHWSLDDVPWFDVGARSKPTAASAWLEAWQGEIASAQRDNRAVTLTFHPEVIGRGYRALALEQLVAHIRAIGVEIITHGELAARHGY